MSVPTLVCNTTQNEKRLPGYCSTQFPLHFEILLTPEVGRNLPNNSIIIQQTYSKEVKNKPKKVTDYFYVLPFSLQNGMLLCDIQRLQMNNSSIDSHFWLITGNYSYYLTKFRVGKKPNPPKKKGSTKKKRMQKLLLPKLTYSTFFQDKYQVPNTGIVELEIPTTRPSNIEHQPKAPSTQLGNIDGENVLQNGTLPDIDLNFDFELF